MPEARGGCYSLPSYPTRLHDEAVPLSYEYGGTTVLAEGTEALGRAESLAKAYPEGWVYIRVEYRGDRV
jgi:hypothetical protein